jgi:hypothetical protein
MRKYVSAPTVSVLTPRVTDGVWRRVGMIQTDGNLTRKPTVYFPADETRLDIRLLGRPVTLNWLKGPPHAEQKPPQDDMA